MPFDVKSAATTASKTVNSAINSSGVVAGLSGAGKALDSLKGAVSNGAGGLVNNLQGLAGQAKSALEAVPKIVDFNPESLIQAAKTVVTVPGKPPFPNILHNYASYNYIWTLSVLSPNDINFPDESYRKGKIGPIILKSASGKPNDRISTVFKSFF